MGIRCWGDVGRDHVHLPLGRARKRVRSINPLTKIAVWQAVCSGQIGRGGKSLALSLRRFASQPELNPRLVNRFVHKDIASASGALWMALSECSSLWVNVALDATRLGGLDVLHLLITLPEFGVSWWSPAQAQIPNFMFLIYFV